MPGPRHILRVIFENPNRAISRLTFRLWGRHRFGSCGTDTWVGRTLSIYNGRQIELGSGCWILEGARLEVVNRPGLPPGRIVIGNRVSIEQEAHITACDRILIEDDVCIAPRVTILDTAHPPGLPGDGNRVLNLEMDRVTTRVCRRAFLGANVVVLPGVTIGENSVIGAGAVVNSDIAPNSVAVGVPARVIRTLPS